jgi:ribonucleoside-diphosphate reductase alpha chain
VISELWITKRNGQLEPFTKHKIISAVSKAFDSVNKTANLEELERITERIKNTAEEYSDEKRYLSVEEIQDLVEVALIDLRYHDVLKSYILYRNQHQNLRHVIKGFSEILPDDSILSLLKDIQKEFDQEKYNLKTLYHRTQSFFKKDMTPLEALDNLIKSSLELTSKDAPNWEYISSRFLNHKLSVNIQSATRHLEDNSFCRKLQYYTEKKLYGSYLLENYTQEDVLELESYMDESRNHLLSYSGLNLLIKRYLIRTFDNEVVENAQEMFMGIAMHLAIPEGKSKVYWAKKFYDIYSTLKVTMATPTMSNARKVNHQLSSCFIDTTPDSLDGIYKTIDNFAQVSKSGGGMGIYYGKVRANGSDIRGFKGVAGGVIRWIRLANDTAVAVDQLGVRQGAVAVYLDAWHKDLPEFLQLKTNNGDDRNKAHDVFPGICFPDLFWKLAKENLENEWHLMCPHEVKTVKGYSLEDYYGDAWEEKFYECVEDEKIHKRQISIKDLVRLMIKSTMETGTPFVFNRDHVNRANPNKHRGMIYSTNLCTEITQNMAPIQTLSKEIVHEQEQDVVVQKSVPGDFVVCNLASLVLGNFNVTDEKELQDVITTVTRALDNVIDLNEYPVPFAQVTNNRYRALGLGTSGYHHMLVNHGLSWESEEHVSFVDAVYEKINYYTIQASMEIAKEKGSYPYFEGSDWHTGEYFTQRGYTDEKWTKLKKDVEKHGLRNGYLLAVAPTGSTSIVAGTTASTDPIMKKYFLEEKKGDIVPRVAPNLTPETYWLYKSAHDIDQTWSLRAAGARQKHMDQSQSLNLYVTTDYTMRQILDLYINAWEEKIKTVYYIRSKSLEVTECESCSS